MDLLGKYWQPPVGLPPPLGDHATVTSDINPTEPHEPPRKYLLCPTTVCFT